MQVKVNCKTQVQKCITQHRTHHHQSCQNPFRNTVVKYHTEELSNSDVKQKVLKRRSNAIRSLWITSRRQTRFHITKCKIGRASCRERVEMSEVAGGLKKKRIKDRR